MNDRRFPRRPDALGVHSVNRFVFTVPDIDEADRFYSAFGLRTVRNGDRVDLYTFGHPHCWASIFANGEPKKLAQMEMLNSRLLVRQ